MKKNKMLRMASAMLILTLLTISIIGGAFAKYTTTGTGSDTARVAKWGVTVSATSNAFADEYAVNGEDISGTTGTISNSVINVGGVNTDDQDVVAPGTNGKLLESTVTGTPEVAVNVTTSANIELNGWTINTNETYCPIIITIDNTEYKMGTATNETTHVYGTVDEFETAVETALNKNDKFGPNTPLGTTYNHNVTWKWDFEKNDYQTNTKDTALGNLANAPTIAFTYTTTVTQID